MNNPRLSVGLIFRDAMQFKKAVSTHSLYSWLRNVHFPWNERYKVGAECNGDCPWFCMAGKMVNSVSLNPT